MLRKRYFFFFFQPLNTLSFFFIFSFPSFSRETLTKFSREPNNLHILRF
ncbi:hypothetical protein WN943_025127 [Citrus x changshan-huyou]